MAELLGTGVSPGVGVGPLRILSGVVPEPRAEASTMRVHWRPHHAAVSDPRPPYLIPDTRYPIPDTDT